MRTMHNAGKTLALGSAALAALAPAYVFFARSASKSLDPYDSLDDIGVGARAGIILVTSMIVALLALLFLLLPATVHSPALTRGTTYWVLVAVVPLATVIGVFLFRSG